MAAVPTDGGAGEPRKSSSNDESADDTGGGGSAPGVDTGGATESSGRSKSSVALLVGAAGDAAGFAGDEVRNAKSSKGLVCAPVRGVVGALVGCAGALQSGQSPNRSAPLGGAGEAAATEGDARAGAGAGEGS